MPRTPINYRDLYFYKIFCKDLNVTECYVGHTTNFTKRKNGHKTRCANPRDKAYDLPVYQYIRDNGGWENWDMILIEQCACEGSLDARKKERVYLEQLKASLNAQIPSRSCKEYSQDNKDRISEHKKKYYEDNREKIIQRAKEYYSKNKFDDEF